MILVKYSGSRSGKGVLVTDSQPEAMATVATLLDTHDDMVVEVRHADDGELDSVARAQGH